MKKNQIKKKNRIYDMTKWIIAFLLLFMNGVIIGILMQVIPDAVSIGGMPFALLYFISAAILLVLYNFLFNRKN